MYNFIDVNEASESVVLPSEALKINGEYIENLVNGYRTLNVSGREALSPELSYYETGVRDGSKLKSKRFPARTIVITYQLIAESNEAFREAYNKLGKILNVEDAELIFNDEQDKFYTGTPSRIGDVEPGSNSVIGEIEILCTDPFKYSVIEYEAEADLAQGNILVDYNGTYKAYPTLVTEFYKEEDVSDDGTTANELTGNGDCGFVAFFNEDEKIIQMGDPEEADGGTHAKSQTLFNANFKNKDSWGTAAMEQWKLNVGITSSSAVQQGGNVGMNVASYSLPTAPAETSGTLLTIRSTAEKPYIDYTVTAKAFTRTENSVKVTVAITASLASDSSYFLSGYVLNASVYIGGKWHNVTLKKSTDQWRGKSAHTVNVTTTVTGLAASTSTLTGIKFKATRGDSNGNTGVLSEKLCKNLTISKYEIAKPKTYYLTPTSYSSGTNWHGASITRTLPADSSGEVGATDFVLSFAIALAIGAAEKATNQLGAIQVLVVSGSGYNRKILAGVNAYKGSSGKKAKLRFYINDAVVNTMDIDLSNANKYFTDAKSSTITKSGQNVTFNIAGLKKTFRDADIADMAASEVTVTFSQYGSQSILSTIGLYSIKFVKNNCDTWANVPNKFSANDVLEAVCKSGEILLNGVSTPSLGALGNDWEKFYLTPGLNQIGFTYSDWVRDGYAPKPKVRYREVFL